LRHRASNGIIIIPACAFALVVAGAFAGYANAAASQWFYNKVLIPEGETVVVPAFDGVENGISLYVPKHLPVIKVPCTTSGTIAFTNTPVGGRSEIRSLVFSCPEGTVVTTILPLSATLVESEYPLHDHWEGITLEYTTGGVNYGTFTGTLDTSVGDVDALFERESEAGRYDERDNFLTFRGGTTKSLAGAGGSRLWLVGTLRLGAKGEAVTDESGLF